MITLRLPIPPSTNELFGVAPGVRRYKTAKYKAWIEAADVALIQQKKAWRKVTINAPYGVEVRLPKIRGDFDNKIKAVQDYLVSRLIVPDDRHSKHPQATFAPELSGECEVVIRQLEAV